MRGDTLDFRTFDGKVLSMPSEVFGWETFPGNFGAPPTAFVTRQGYQQHGVTEVNYTLGPRDFDLEFWRASACDRATYWANRSEVLNYFRPNRNGPLRMTLTQMDGTQRSLNVRAQPGPQYTAQQSNNNDIRESLSFVAFDPIWFDPTANSVVIGGSLSPDLVFPITFPIKFGPSGLLFVTTVTYTGTWKTYPLITLTGPYNAVTLTNLTTGISIFMNSAINAGETRIIDLTPGAQSIVDGSGTDAFDELGPNSNLVNFNIRPTPEVSGGINNFSIVMNGGTAGVSGVTLAYNNRYFGI